MLALLLMGQLVFGTGGGVSTSVTCSGGAGSCWFTPVNPTPVEKARNICAQHHNRQTCGDKEGVWKCTPLTWPKEWRDCAILNKRLNDYYADLMKKEADADKTYVTGVVQGRIK